ncbi:ADP-ribose 1''-phosphate phosphatase [Blastomyces dermatitidis]|uniref:ADP-ribose 1''-phosphate phosphatase n=3 Tax=Blastomyces TaxID=229219 RepID=A0A179UYT1_BLAGS|nr:ADP-ribose 1''-phosphate phosphatase [Blastomyces gilchristii SLH14081]XP_045276516.1 ADP-ribose 1''-phosphate phosphatase [Blastomyces dermatitidis ER-3]EEQ89638.2 ADP-ribose 1''-phosphate phosphatase [Blastomyces dermatitidis ER-3]EGE80578.2 ADP-ribose 1''-phosphate phosphatase [Blastomyces dermatitidis ATCC 18188]OAT12201.1 ADP-ribose 1''-phosphate phosphatase [Blastomyces gilchristii SLH14081]
MMSIITEIEGDLFDAPEGTALIHACNCQGSWGKGIAKVFREKFPAAYQIFRAHCQQYLSHPQTQTHTGPQLRALKLPEGTALIIPPQPADYQPLPQSQPQPQTGPASLSNRGRGQGRGRGRGRGGRGAGATFLSRVAGRKHWIICLFTSWHYGPRNRSPPDVILENTRLAMADLKRQVAAAAAPSTTITTTSTAVAVGDDEVEQPGELWGCRFNAGLFGVPWERTREVLEEAGLAMTIVRPLGESE